MKGYLITLEGIDGTGKTTVASQLSRLLSDKGLVFTAEPTSSEIGKIIRKELADNDTPKDLFEELFLFMADHAGHLSRTITPALKSGKTVLCDRYSDSRAAYQGATLDGLVPDPVDWIQRLHLPWSPKPDLTLFFYLDPKIAVQRCKKRENENLTLGSDRFERAEFLKKVSDNFERIKEMEPQRFATIDAAKDIEDVVKDSFEIIDSFLLRSRDP